MVVVSERGREWCGERGRSGMGNGHGDGKIGVNILGLGKRITMNKGLLVIRIELNSRTSWFISITISIIVVGS